MKSVLEKCGSRRHVPAGCKEMHVPARKGEECPACRKKTRDAWRAARELERKTSEAAKKRFTATA